MIKLRNFIRKIDQKGSDQTFNGENMKIKFSSKLTLHNQKTNDEKIPKGLPSKERGPNSKRKSCLIEHNQFYATVQSIGAITTYGYQQAKSTRQKMYVADHENSRKEDSFRVDSEEMRKSWCCSDHRRVRNRRSN